MRGRDHSYPGVQLVALKITEDRLFDFSIEDRYFPANFVKFFTTPTQPVEQL